MRKLLENIVLMIVIFFLVAAIIPAAFAQGDDDRDELRLYNEMPDLIIEHARIADFDEDGVCDGLRVYYKNNGRNGFQIDDDGFMASIVINNLYSSGYAGIYTEEIDLPEELERIKSGQKFHDTISYEALLEHGFRSGEENRILVRVDTRGDIEELNEGNNEAIFFVDDEECKEHDYDNDEKDDEKNHDGDKKNEHDYDKEDKQDYDEEYEKDDVNTCVAAHSLFLNEGEVFKLGENEVKVEVLEVDDDVAVFRVNGKLLDVQVGHGKDFENGMLWLKGVGKKPSGQYAVFLLECGEEVKEIDSHNLNQDEQNNDEQKDKDKPEDKPEKQLPREDELCEDGCKKEEMCLGIGLRLIADESPVYCDLDGELKDQKREDVSCQNNYECESNTCQSGACVDLQEQLRQQMGMLERILKWFEAIFG